MPGVQIKEGESIESALRRFRMVCRDARIQEDYKRSLVYEKPSERRRRKIKESQRRSKKAKRRMD